MNKSCATRKKKGRGKKDTGQQKWRRRLREWGVSLLMALAFLAVYVPANFLAGCTLVFDLPDVIFWMVLVGPAVLLVIWAWFKGNMGWGEFGLYVITGYMAGFLLVCSIMTVFLGINYLVPRSEPYNCKAVITSMKEENHYQQMAHNYVYFRIPDNGVRFSYDCNQKQYDSLRIGDTCMVTFRDGILGFPVIRKVEPTGRSPRPSREELKTLINKFQYGRTGITAPEMVDTEKNE